MWEDALTPTVSETWEQMRATRNRAVRFEAEAPVSRQGLVLLIQPWFCEQGTEDRGLGV